MHCWTGSSGILISCQIFIGCSDVVADHLLQNSATNKWLTSHPSYGYLSGRLGHHSITNIFLLNPCLLWLSRNSASLSNLKVIWALVMCYLILPWLNDRSCCCVIRQLGVQVMQPAFCKYFANARLPTTDPQWIRSFPESCHGGSFIAPGCPFSHL